MEQREVNLLLNVKDIILDKIKPLELYQQKDLIELLDVSLNTFKKYFTSDKKWCDDALIYLSRSKYYKGYYLRMKAIELWGYAEKHDLLLAIKKANALLKDFEGQYILKPNDEFDLDQILMNQEYNEYFSHFLGNKDEENSYWETKLKELE